MKIDAFFIYRFTSLFFVIRESSNKHKILNVQIFCHNNTSEQVFVLLRRGHVVSSFLKTGLQHIPCTVTTYLGRKGLHLSHRSSPDDHYKAYSWVCTLLCPGSYVHLAGIWKFCSVDLKIGTIKNISIEFLRKTGRFTTQTSLRKLSPSRPSI